MTQIDRHQTLLAVACHVPSEWMGVFASHCRRAAAGCAFTGQHQISDWAAHPASDGLVHHHGGSVGWGFLK